MKTIKIIGTTVMLANLVACGGGGDSAEGGQGPSSVNKSLAVLTKDNAPVAAGATAYTANSVNSTGGSSGKLLASLTGSPGHHFTLVDFSRLQAEKLISQDGQLMPISAAAATSQSFGCKGGGTYTASWDDKNTQTLADDVVTMTFGNCVEDGETTNGKFTMAFASVTGNIVTGTAWAFTAKVTFDNFAYSAPGDSGSMHGSTNISISTTNSVIYDYAIAGTSSEILTISDNVETVELSNYTMKGSDNDSTHAYRYDFTGHVVSTKLDGAFDAATTVSFEGVGDNDPEKGIMVLNGANGSKVIMTAIDSTNVRLDTDSNGDGVIDDTQTVTWVSL